MSHVCRHDRAEMRATSEALALRQSESLAVLQGELFCSPDIIRQVRPDFVPSAKHALPIGEQPDALHPHPLVLVVQPCSQSFKYKT